MLFQFLAQCFEDFFSRIGAVIVFQLFERFGLSGFKKGPEVILSDAVLGVRDIGLLKNAILVLAD